MQEIQKKPTKPTELPSIYVPAENNQLLATVLREINTNEEVHALWEVVNVNAIQRLGMSDHGTVHVQIVANSALRLARLLNKNGVHMSIVRDFGLTYEHAEVVLLLASLLHDIGMTVDRRGHETFSLFLANNLLREILANFQTHERTIIISETLHAITSHRSGGNPITVEAGVVRVADALDMTEGRARISYEAHIVNMYSLSGAAIDQVTIREGQEKPIQIEISMNNSSGIFQVDDLLKTKLSGSGIESYVTVRAFVDREDEKKLLDEFIF